MSAPRIINPATAGGGVPVGGSGAAGYVAKWTAATTLGGSTTTGATASLYVDATGNIGIGTASPATLLHVNGNQIGGAGASVTPYAHALFGPSSAYTMWWKTNATAGGGVIGTAGPGIQFYVVSGSPNAPTVLQVANFDSTGNFILGAASGVSIQAAGTNQGLKLATTPGNTNPNTLDCYDETDVSSGYTLSGVTTTSGAITVAIRATRIGRTMTFAVSIAPAGGASLTFAAAWYLTMTGVSAPAFAGSLAVSSNDATVTRGTAWVNAVAAPTVYGSAAALGANVSLFLNGTI